MINRVWLVIGLVVVLAAGIAAFAAYGHGGHSGSASQQLESWVSSTGLGQEIGALEGDSANVRKALAGHEGTTAVRTVCAAMANDAQTFNGNLPSPDTQVTQLLARAYGLDYDGAEACYRAGSTNQPLLVESARDRSKAAGLFGRVLQRIRAVTDHPLSTTTTTVVNETSTSIL
jgi:hypothetical protein